MEIVPHIGNGLIGQTAGLSGSPDVASPLDKQNAQQPGPLTITEAPANPGDISTAPIQPSGAADAGIFVNYLHAIKGQGGRHEPYT